MFRDTMGGKKKGEKQYSNELAAHQLKKKKTKQR